MRVSFLPFSPLLHIKQDVLVWCVLSTIPCRIEGMQRNLYRLNRESFKLAAGGICCHVHNKDCGTNHWHLLVTLWLAVKLTGLLASLDTTKTTPLVQISRQLHPIFSLHSIASRLKGPNEVFWHISKSILTKQFGLSQKNSKKNVKKLSWAGSNCAKNLSWAGSTCAKKFELSRLDPGLGNEKIWYWR